MFRTCQLCTVSSEPARGANYAAVNAFLRSLTVSFQWLDDESKVLKLILMTRLCQYYGAKSQKPFNVKASKWSLKYNKQT